MIEQSVCAVFGDEIICKLTFNESQQKCFVSFYIDSKTNKALPADDLRHLKVILKT